MPWEYVPRPLGEIVRDVLSRGDDRPWTTPQESRGEWSEERLAGWRTDPDVMAQLAALTSLDFSKYELGSDMTGKSTRDVENGHTHVAENNLAHLLEYTPGLKTLNLAASRGRSPFPHYSYGNPLLFNKGTKSF